MSTLAARRFEEPFAITRQPEPSQRPRGLFWRLRWLALGLIFLGLGCRLLRYCLHFPFWGDEAMLCVNFLDRDYLGLMKQLSHFQVAPLLFLWGELTAFRLLGPSEWALRLLPTLAGLSSVIVYWYLARTTLRPSAAVLALGMLLGARWPVTMTTSVKPYSFDLLFACLLTLAALRYLRNPERNAWLILLTAMVPVALLSSYPSVFIAGSVSLVLLPAVLRGRWSARAWYLAYNLLLFATFLFAYLVVGHEQLDPVEGTVKNYMFNYWRDGFPPDNPWHFPLWLVQITTGRMMAYPVGDSNGGSTATVLLFLGGAWLCLRRRRYALLGMCLLPMVLNLVAALVYRFPYGACGRLSQHLGPAICLLAGSGLAGLLDWARPRSAPRGRIILIAGGVLALCAAVQLIMDLRKPYRDYEALWSVKLAHLLVDKRSPSDQVVVWNKRKEMEPVIQWQLGRLGRRLTWEGKVDWDRLEKSGGELWAVSFWTGPEWTPELFQSGPPVIIDRPGWVKVDQASYGLTPWCTGQCQRRCKLTRWMWLPSHKMPAPYSSLDSWPP